MLDILIRSIARAGGIESGEDVRLAHASYPGPSPWRRIVTFVRRWRIRRSTYATLTRLDDRLLRDIGLDRGTLHETAEVLARQPAANDNKPGTRARPAAAFERWHRRRSTYLALQQLDDRILKDIGLRRGMLLGVADRVARRAVSQNAMPVTLADPAANDNDPCVSVECG